MEQTIPNKQNNFASISMLLAILALMSMLFIFPPFIFGGLSILFAILGKGYTSKISSSGKVAITTSIISMALTVCILISSMKLVMSDPTYHEQLNQMSEQMYGESFDDMLNQIIGK